MKNEKKTVGIGCQIIIHSDKECGEPAKFKIVGEHVWEGQAFVCNKHMHSFLDRAAKDDDTHDKETWTVEFSRFGFRK